MNKKSVPNYLNVFERKLEALKNRIAGEIEKPKKERSRAKLKMMLKEAKGLTKTIRSVRQDHAMKCPHCGKNI